MSNDAKQMNTPSTQSPEGKRVKVASKADIGKSQDMETDYFGGSLQIPSHIKKELEAAGLVARFVSMKKISDNGGYHPRGWTPYTIKNPNTNPITGQAESIFRVGDLVLAVKTLEMHKKHLDFLKNRSAMQSQSQKDSVKAMRDKIREGRADKHISLLEGYDEDDKDDE